MGGGVCFFTCGSSVMLRQEVNLGSSQINRLSLGWITSARRGSFSPSEAEDAIQNHNRCFAPGPDHLSLGQIMAQAFLILDPATELLLHVTWTPPPPLRRTPRQRPGGSAEDGRVLLLCEINRDRLVGFSPSPSALRPLPSSHKAASPCCINALQRPQSSCLAAGYSPTGEAKV